MTGAAAILVALSYACMYGRYGQWLDATLDGALPFSWGKKKGGLPVRASPYCEWAGVLQTLGLGHHSKADGGRACACMHSSFAGVAGGAPRGT